MTTGGWIFIVLSWGIIVVLCVLTFSRTLGLKIENMIAPLDIDTEKKTGGRRKKK